MRSIDSSEIELIYSYAHVVSSEAARELIGAEGVDGLWDFISDFIEREDWEIGYQVSPNDVNSSLCREGDLRERLWAAYLFVRSWLETDQARGWDEDNGWDAFHDYGNLTIDLALLHAICIKMISVFGLEGPEPRQEEAPKQEEEEQVFFLGNKATNIQLSLF